MTLTFLDLYNECAGQPWSMYDADAESIDDLESALKISINKATSFLWNEQPWNFRIKTKKITTKSGTASYNLPNGMLVRKVVGGVQCYGVKYDGDFLNYESDYEGYSEDDKTVSDGTAATPEGFFVANDKLYIYPTPDAAYTINLEYLLLPYGLDSDEEEVYELTEEDDYINIPEKYESLFKNCLISKAMLYAIADETDENYNGYLAQYEDAHKTLLQYCLDSIVDRYIVW